MGNIPQNRPVTYIFLFHKKCVHLPVRWFFLRGKKKIMSHDFRCHMKPFCHHTYLSSATCIIEVCNFLSNHKSFYGAQHVIFQSFTRTINALVLACKAFGAACGRVALKFCYPMVSYFRICLSIDLYLSSWWNIWFGNMNCRYFQIECFTVVMGTQKHP